MRVKIAADFKNLFRSLSDSEREQAEANNLADPKHERVPPVAVWANHENTIVDGHHTYRIRTKLALHIRYAKLTFDSRDEAMAYAIRCQLGRRNLTPSEMSMAIAKLPKAKTGPKDDGELSANLRITREQLAEEHGISDRTLTHADKVTEHGSAAVVNAVTQGEVAVSDAAAIADLPKSEQNAALQAVRDGEAPTLRAAAKPRAKKGGKVVFDYKKWESKVGDLIRLTDDHHKLYPDRTMHAACHESLNTYLADMKAWRKKKSA